ncbi:LVIVD repeat-containing protein [Natrialbaceae archaeon GCM10025810]|uniref:LVIVD repeat-containing protein n=1 Tax=Halovalidus salilacus TaxID=3075124 RepID=UPI0036070784
MRRRAFLRSSAASATGLALAGPGIGSTAALTSGSAVQDEADGNGDGDGYEPLGRVSISGACEAVVGDDGETAYVAAKDGFATVDVSDPAEPTMLAEERDLLADEDEEFADILDVAVSGDRLVVPGPANETTQPYFHGFLVYDVSDPADPVLAAEPYETGVHIHNCFLEGDRLYVVENNVDDSGTATNPLVIYDLSDDEVEEVGTWSPLDHEPEWADVHWLVRYLHDVYVQDEVAYLPYWDAGTYVVDVSDPADPELLSSLRDDDVDLDELIEASDDETAVMDAQQALPGNDHYAAVDDDGELLAIGREAWAIDEEGPRPGGIDLYDVRDLEDPTHLATIEAPRAAIETYDGGLWTTSHNFELRDGELYSSWYQAGVKIYDVSDPESPEEIAAWRDPNEAGFWTARVAVPDETFVASSTELIAGAPTDGGLYTFPIEAGEQADPPSLTDPDELDVEIPDGGNESEESEDESGGDENEDEDDGANAIPGFTGPAGLAGGALALERLRRRAEPRETPPERNR